MKQTKWKGTTKTGIKLPKLVQPAQKGIKPLNQVCKVPKDLEPPKPDVKFLQGSLVSLWLLKGNLRLRTGSFLTKWRTGEFRASSQASMNTVPLVRKRKRSCLLWISASQPERCLLYIIW